MANGEETYLGDISMQRCTDGKLLAVLAGVQPKAEEEVIARRYAEENSRRSIGDPEIVWDFGGMSLDVSNSLPCVLTRPLNGQDYLKPSHHGQGIMTDAIGTLLWRWAVPRMGVRRIIATVFGGNHGSVRVFQKNGFILTKRLENYLEVNGKMRDVLLMEWNFDTVDKQPSA
jgi:RimJ/RimL family protein N-acetyltransferase